MGPAGTLALGPPFGRDDDRVEGKADADAVVDLGAKEVTTMSE